MPNTVKLRATITIDYDADPENYREPIPNKNNIEEPTWGPVPNVDRMIEIDHEYINENPLDFIDEQGWDKGSTFTVKVEERKP